MSRKIFVSYKHNDSQVLKISSLGTCRDYVDVIMERIEDIHIYKGEEDDNDMSKFKDDTIWTTLKEKIRDSSVTIVLVSEGMRTSDPEVDQWIPLEISYSLKQKTFNGRTSYPNGVLAVVIPDQTGTYDHYFEYGGCNTCNVVTHKTNNLFGILEKNMFNKKIPSKQSCISPFHESTHHVGTDHSYIPQVKWDDFIADPDPYIDRSINHRDRMDEFNMRKDII